MLDKQTLRAESLRKRRKIPPAQRLAKSKKIFLKLSRDEFFRDAAHVALYCGITPEVVTRPFLKAILKDKKVYFPRVEPGSRSMKFRRVLSCSRDLVRGTYGIMEPKARCPAYPSSRMDIIIVPGMAFDRRGVRLGRGAGYYDRLLKKAPKVVKIGLCFREQLIRKVPMTEHDVAVDRVITD